MDNAKKSHFSFRSFVSTLTMFSFVMVIFAGAILFVTPPGRVANWTGWKLIGLGKDQWISVHICFAIIFLIASTLHIYLNFKPLMNYFTNRATKKFSFRPEWLAAAVITSAVLLGTLAAIPPFSSVMSIRHRLKFSWDESARRDSMPHYEAITPARLEKNAELDLDAANRR